MTFFPEVATVSRLSHHVKFSTLIKDLYQITTRYKSCQKERSSSYSAWHPRMPSRPAAKRVNPRPWCRLLRYLISIMSMTSRYDSIDQDLSRSILRPILRPFMSNLCCTTRQMFYCGESRVFTRPEIRCYRVRGPWHPVAECDSRGNPWTSFPVTNMSSVSTLLPTFCTIVWAEYRAMSPRMPLTHGGRVKVESSEKAPRLHRQKAAFSICQFWKTVETSTCA